MNVLEKKNYVDYSYYTNEVKDWFSVDLSNNCESVVFESMIWTSNVVSGRWSFYPDIIFFEYEEDYNNFKVSLIMGTFEENAKARINGKLND